MGQEETICDSENEVRKDITANENFPKSNREYVRNKMEAMQKKIDELKEKVKNEGQLLHSEASYKTYSFDEKLQDSLNHTENSFEQHTSENESNSDKSLYYSASNYSLCSLSTSSSDNAYNFTKFVNNFGKNQNQKERLSLLRLHSEKQISLNMLRHSLSDLDTRCAEELELIERSLRHLNRLAAEFNVNVPSDGESEDGKLKALEFHRPENEEDNKLKARSNPAFIWPNEERKSRMNIISNPEFFKISSQDNSSWPIQ